MKEGKHLQVFGAKVVAEGVDSRQEDGLDLVVTQFEGALIGRDEDLSSSQGHLGIFGLVQLCETLQQRIDVVRHGRVFAVELVLCGIVVVVVVVVVVLKKCFSRVVLVIH